MIRWAKGKRDSANRFLFPHFPLRIGRVQWEMICISRDLAASKPWPRSSTPSPRWARCSLPRLPTPNTSTTVSSSGGQSLSSDRPVSRKPDPTDLRANRRASVQEGSMADSRSHHIRLLLVYWKVGQQKNCQRLVRFPFQILFHHTGSTVSIRSTQGMMHMLTSWPLSSPDPQTVVLHKTDTATFSTSLPVGA